MTRRPKKIRKPPTSEQVAKRVLDRIERASVRAVSIVVEKINNDGTLDDYDGIEAAREIRALMTKVFSDFARSRTFNYQAQLRIKKIGAMRLTGGQQG